MKYTDGPSATAKTEHKGFFVGHDIHGETDGKFLERMAELPELEPPKYLQESIERQIRLPLQGRASGVKQGFFGNWLSANWLRTGLHWQPEWY